MGLFEYVHRHVKAFLFAVAVLCASGVVSMLQMPVSLFPDIAFPRIVILAENGEQPAERMMVEVTKPLEEAASSVPGVKLVRSITSRGSSEISINLDWGSDVQQTLQIIQGRIAGLGNLIPPTATVQSEQMQVSVFPILGYSLTSDTLSLVELRDIALYQLRPALMRVNGVAGVEVVGGDTREFLVTVSPEKLAAFRVDVSDVANAIQTTNSVTSSGLIDNNHQLYLSLVSGLFTTSDDIGSDVITARNGVPLRISDVAEVKPGLADKFIRTRANGREAVLLNIIKQPTGSTVQIGSDVIAAFGKIRMPAGVTVENFYDQGGFIRSSIRSTRDSIVIGILLSMIVLLVFLRSWRVTIVIAVIVPATITVTLLFLSAVGQTINIMTLGGIAAAVGLIIDDSIVVIENIFAHIGRQESAPVHDGSGFTALAGASIRELTPAIVGSTASTVVINIPLAFLGGVTGAFFTSLSITMVFALLTSFILSVSLAPLLASFVAGRKDIRHELRRKNLRHGVKRSYERTLRSLLKYRLAFIPASLVIFYATYVLYDSIGSDFMPEMDEGTFVLDYTTPPGTSLGETDRILRGVENMLLTIPEIESYSRRTGTQLGFFITEPNSGDYLVKLRDDRSRNINDVIAEVRERIAASEPRLNMEFGQLMMDVIGDLTNNPSPVEIKLFGSDATILQSKAEEVSSLIAAIPGVVDVFSGIVISGPSFIVHVDPLKAALMGLSVGEVQDRLETIIRGRSDTEIQRGEKLIPIRVRYPDNFRFDTDKIEELTLMNSEGVAVPLRSIAAIERTTGQAELHREGLMPLVAVTARISGRDLGRTITDIRDRLAGTLVLPQSVTLQYGGVYQTQQESFRGLLVVALSAMALVFIVLLFEFGEFAVPLAILVINILSLFGVFGALWLTRVSFNISSFVGIIMIIGIVAENSIFVLHNVKTLESDGVALDDALVTASLMRSRPIVMTTLAAVFALLPLSLGLGAGAQMQQPLAIAVIGGFSVSSMLLFIGLPLVYRLLRFGKDDESLTGIS